MVAMDELAERSGFALGRDAFSQRPADAEVLAGIFADGDPTPDKTVSTYLHEIRQRFRLIKAIHRYGTTGRA